MGSISKVLYEICFLLYIFTQNNRTILAETMQAEIVVVKPEELKAMDLFDTIMLVISGTDWKKIFNDPKVKEGLQFVSNTFKKTNVDHIPAPLEIPTAFVWTSFAKTEVVWIGQDPYPESGVPVGASFSIRRETPLTMSLRNIFEVYHRTLGYEKPTHGCLLSWAVQGVLFLNTALTVKPGKPNSDATTWNSFTHPFIRTLSNSKPLLFILLGKEAQDLKAEIKGVGHDYIIAPHPVSRDGSFLHCDIFREINKTLEKRNKPRIKWQLPK